MRRDRLDSIAGKCEEFDDDDGYQDGKEDDSKGEIT